MANNFNADDNIETKIIKINEKLSQKCRNFIIRFTNHESNQMELSLIYERTVVSNIFIFVEQNNMFYINIETLPEYEKNGFVTFLMAVLVYIGNSIHISESFVPIKIGLTAQNPISALIVINNFDTSSIKTFKTGENQLTKAEAEKIIMEQLKEKEEGEINEEDGEDRLIVEFNIQENINNAITLIETFFSSRKDDYSCKRKIMRKRKTDETGGMRTTKKNEKKHTRKNKKKTKQFKKNMRKSKKSKRKSKRKTRK